MAVFINVRRNQSQRDTETGGVEPILNFLLGRLGLVRVFIHPCVKHMSADTPLKYKASGLYIEVEGSMMSRGVLQFGTGPLYC